MARKVFISSDMSIDEAVSEVAESNPVAALIWPWILTYFDDWGRAKASPREIKNSVFPANDLITIEIIGQAIILYGIRLVHLYQVDGKPFMCINLDKWFKYQTHIRREKRENDGSKHPAPPLVAECAQVRASARGVAHISDNLTDCIPSPSPSPSISTTTTGEEVLTVMDAYKKATGQLFCSPLVSDFFLKVKSMGYTDHFLIELLLEAGESATGKVTERFLKTIFERWDKEKIYSRSQSRERKTTVNGSSNVARAGKAAKWNGYRDEFLKGDEGA